MRERFETILSALNKNLYERKEHVNKVFLATISGESVFLLGPPGVAKSLIARRLKFAFKDSKIFEYLMNRFSTPEEIFGPISISKLRDEDKLERIVENYLPDANIAFLDEIWKAGPSIQNTLLTIINEKVFRNGSQVIEVPLVGLIAASNELPAKNQGLEALWDRFLIRLVVENIADRESFASMVRESSNIDNCKISSQTQISVKEYNSWRNAIATIEVGDEIIGVINHIRMMIKAYNSEENRENLIYVSDRRWKKIIKILRTSAFVNGREKVDLMDCYLIADMIWDEPEQMNQVNVFVREAIAKNGYTSGIDMNKIKNSIKALEDEIRMETVIINEHKKRVYKRKKQKGIKNYLYEIDTILDYGGNNFSRRNNIKYVQFQAGDIDKAKVGGNITLYDANYNQHADWKISNISESFIQSSNQNTLTIAMTEKVYYSATARKPHQILTNAWNEKIREMLLFMENLNEALKKKEKDEFGQLRTNLFVNPEKADHILENFNRTKKDLQKLKLKLEEIKHSYENIKEGEKVELESLNMSDKDAVSKMNTETTDSYDEEDEYYVEEDDYYYDDEY